MAMRSDGEGNRSGASVPGSRRQILVRGAAGIGIGAFSMVLPLSRARAAPSLTIRDPGGAYTTAFTEAFYKPFSKETGIEVIPVTAMPEPAAEVKGMVDTKSYAWDLVLLSLAAHDLLRDAGYLEALELDNDPNVKEIPERFRGPYLIGDEVYATVLAYRKDRKGPPPVNGWKDLWNVKGFPGRRGLHKHVFDTIEISLLADGVPPSKVYPCDFDRAYRSLDRIKADIAVWWSTGAEATQLLTNGELDLCVTWNGRAQAAIDNGAPVAMSWTEGLYTYSGWSIPKGAPKADLARKFISFASRADRQAAYTSLLSVGPTNPGAYAYIPAARSAVLPTSPENLSKMIQIDSAFWGKYKDVAMERFLTWVIQ
jgi:putative spermidine/putrescine transport system substrate-binding protein